MVKKVLFYIVAIFIVTIVSMPKLELYYTFAHYLQNHSINIKNEKYQEGFFGLSLKDAIIEYRNNNIGNIDEINIYNFLFVSKITCNNMQIKSSYNKKEIIHINQMNAMWSIFSPKKVYISMDSNLGELNGDFDISLKILKIYFENEKDINNLKEFLKKDNEGWYYESIF